MKKPHKILLFNGPRRSGKDTAFNFIYKNLPVVRHRKFAAPLKMACAAMFDVSKEHLKALEALGSTIKTVPDDRFMGRSWVELLMWMSEICMKNEFGSDIMGRLMVTELQKPTSAPLTVITDCGFKEEAMPLIDAFGKENVSVVKLLRPGYTFEGDSRDYIPHEFITHFIDNRFDLELFERQVMRVVRRVLEDV